VSGDSGHLRDVLLAVLAEDAHNAERLTARLDAVSREHGVGAHSALLLILTRLAFEEPEARRHWEAILEHRAGMSSLVGRDVGVRVAVLDYFLHVNRQMVQPTLIDLRMLEATADEGDRDRLTGLAADRPFRTAVQAELRRARRYQGQVAVALFDLDGFAEINLRAGSLVGDRLLREAAGLLHDRIRDIDLAARPGEDELAVLLPGTDRHGALLVAERYRRELEGHFGRREVAGIPLGMTVSGGVACYPDDARSPEALLERAARALYAAKASGKNAVLSYQPERRRFVRFELEPGRFEVEVLGPRELGRCRTRDASRSGILFVSPEPLDVGETVEIRLLGRGADGNPGPSIRGRVVRLEEIPELPPEPGEPTAPLDRFEVGLVLEDDEAGARLLEVLERIRGESAEGGVGADP
jgi:diguanylate cyclase (GGDEF)-like protein